MINVLKQRERSLQWAAGTQEGRAVVAFRGRSGEGARMRSDRDGAARGGKPCGRDESGRWRWWRS